MITELKITQAHHKGEDCLFLHFHKDPETIFHLKSRYGAKWSQNNAAWYIRNQGNAYTEIEKYCAERRIYFVEQESVEISKATKGSTVMKQIWLLNESSRIKLEKFEYWLRSKRYSENTIKTYTDAVRTFLQFHYPKEISEIDNEDVVVFNNEYIIVRNLSSSYQNQVVNALKLLLTTIDKRTINIELIHRPKREKKLPNVLSKEEIKLILDAPSNYKHRAMLSLIYSCGLRCGELLRLKPEDIDSGRGLVIIRQSKGKKDRVIPLSPKILDLLRNYYRCFRPVTWLFEGQRKGIMYDERSLQNVLRQSVLKAGITRPVTLHWLRHSYATHLLENGTDLRYIQELLGHSRSTTTEIYTHVSNQQIQKIISPFDTL